MQGQGAIIDFQSIYAALLMLRRDPETGRYPERDPADAHLLALAEYVTRKAMIYGGAGDGHRNN